MNFDYWFGEGVILFHIKLLDKQKTFLLTFDFGHTAIRVISAKSIKTFNNNSKSLPCL